MPNDKTKKTKTTKKAGASQSSPASSPSYPGFIPPRGGYEDLLAYRKSQIIYDATVRFCDRFIDKRSRTHDQMVQTARSGNKNIAEGSQISGTSKESEIKLTSVARASPEELLGDYRDYLRHRGFTQWDKNSREALYVRKLGSTNHESYASYRSFMESRPAEVVANILICLIHQANYLLHQQLRQLEEEFLQAGGLRERMTRARLAIRTAEKTAISAIKATTSATLKPSAQSSFVLSADAGAGGLRLHR